MLLILGGLATAYFAVESQLSFVEGEGKNYSEDNRQMELVFIHENDEEATTLEAKIVQAADMISKSRPGANKDNLENFVKRLREIENVANAFEGVKKSYAVQAGRHVRVGGWGAGCLGADRVVPFLHDVPDYGQDRLCPGSPGR